MINKINNELVLKKKASNNPNTKKKRYSFMDFCPTNHKEPIGLTNMYKMSGIYFLFDKDDTVIYIGKSHTSIHRRLHDHKRKHYKHAKYFSFVEINNEQDIIILEYYYIGVFSPILNNSSNYEKTSLSICSKYGSPFNNERYLLCNIGSEISNSKRIKSLEKENKSIKEKNKVLLTRIDCIISSSSSKNIDNLCRRILNAREQILLLKDRGMSYADTLSVLSVRKKSELKDFKMYGIEDNESNMIINGNLKLHSLFNKLE